MFDMISKLENNINKWLEHLERINNHRIPKENNANVQITKKKKCR